MTIRCQSEAYAVLSTEGDVCLGAKYSDVVSERLIVV
jgi:hypothetical protein